MLIDPKVSPTRAKQLFPDAAAVVILTLVLAFFYWGFLLGRHFMWEDTLEEFYPGVNYFAKSLHAGRFPLWFPGVRDGLPFYSDIQLAVFYPLQWLLIPFVRGGRLPFLVYQWYIVLHYLLGGLFMYAFLKQIKLSAMAALSGALVFCLSGFSSLHIVQSPMIQVYIWLPLQLLFVHRLTSGGGRRAWLGLVGAMLMSLLAGYPQITLYCWYLVIAYWLYRCCVMRRNDGSVWRTAMRWVVRKDAPKLAGTFALVFGLGAVMILPAAESWWHTSRPRQVFEQLADQSLPYHDLLTLGVPNFFGKSGFANVPVLFWGFDPDSLTVRQSRTAKSSRGFWQYWEFGAYAGQIFWLGLLLILFNWRRIEDKRSLGFFLVTWVTATWFMLGRFGGLYPILYHVLPGVSLFRGPARMSCVATLAAAVLTAHAVNLLRERAPTFRCWPALLPAAGFAGLALVLWAGGKHLAAGLSDSAKLNWSLHETSIALAASIVSALAVVGAGRAQRRWMAIVCLGSFPVVLAADFYHAYGDFQRGPFHPALYYYSKTARWLQDLEEYSEQQGPVRFGQTREELVAARNLACFYDYLEVPEGYISFCPDNIATFQGITNEEARLAIQNIEVMAEADGHGGIRFGTRTNALPRVKFFAHIRRYDSNAALLGALERGEIDWRKEAAVCEWPTVNGSRWDDRDQAPDANDRVQFDRMTPESYWISYNVRRPGVIFVSQTFYPGWVTTDARTKLIEVFGAFQGIVIPEAGRGQVVLRFAPVALRLGIAITLISVVVVAALALGRWCRGSRDSGDPGTEAPPPRGG